MGSLQIFLWSVVHISRSLSLLPFLCAAIRLITSAAFSLQVMRLVVRNFFPFLFHWNGNCNGVTSFSAAELGKTSVDRRLPTCRSARLQWNICRYVVYEKFPGKTVSTGWNRLVGGGQTSHLTPRYICTTMSTILHGAFILSFELLIYFYDKFYKFYKK